MTGSSDKRHFIVMEEQTWNSIQALNEQCNIIVAGWFFSHAFKLLSLLSKTIQMTLCIIRKNDLHVRNKLTEKAS